MIFDLDDLLDHVDEWKFKLYEKLKQMTPEEEAAFWREAHEKARAAGYRVADAEPEAKPRAKRRPRATG